MIRVVQCRSGKAARNYYTKADYYLEKQELAGQWGGSAADMLGLYGLVEKQPFDLLCENRHPVTGERLTVRTRADRTPGYDINFHCPKSVSLLYAMTGDADILDAFRWAVDQTMHGMEARMMTRVRQGRQCFDRLVGNLAWAEYVHFTARPVGGEADPHLHAHCFCFNAVFDPLEQRWKAGQFRAVKQEAPRFQALFRSLLARRLADLGYGVAWQGDSFEIAGLSPALLRKFSRRTAQIEQLADALGIASDRVKDRLGALTRERKQLDATMPQMRQRWRRRMTVEERTDLAAAGLKGRRIAGPAYRHGHPAHGLVMRRQRHAAYERTRAAQADAAPPPQRLGYGR